MRADGDCQCKVETYGRAPMCYLQLSIELQGASWQLKTLPFIYGTETLAPRGKKLRPICSIRKPRIFWSEVLRVRNARLGSVSNFVISVQW